MDTPELIASRSPTATSSRTVDQVLNTVWSEKERGEGSRRSVAVVEELENDNAAAFSAPSSLIVDDDFMLKMDVSLVLMIVQNVLLQISLFSVVTSSSVYAEHFGGTNTFAGLVNGIPTAISALTLTPIMRMDKGQYRMPLHITCATMALGSVLYGLAYKAGFLYLILLGRMVQGIGFNGFLYTKRYITDPRVAGVRRRTTLAGFLVLGQGIGMSAGPFFGGLLFKVGFGNAVFNGYTAPGWITAGMWLAYWAACAAWFEDVPLQQARSQEAIELTEMAAPRSSTNPLIRRFGLSARQLGVIVTMCWFAMTCFFILGAWESNIPVFGASGPSSSPTVTSHSILAHTVSHLPVPLHMRSTSSIGLSPFHWSPFASGNFIALGGVSIFPFLFLNLLMARRTQDRHILALGAGLGLAGLLIALGLLRGGALSYGSFFVSWFLVALGFNLATTCTLSLLTKQLPQEWNSRTSIAIQVSNYTGRVTGAVWGGSGIKVGMLNYLGLEIAFIGIGAAMFMTLWRELKAKTG